MSTTSLPERSARLGLVTPDVRRRADDSIDIDFYLRRGAMIRSQVWWRGVLTAARRTYSILGARNELWRRQQEAWSRCQGRAGRQIMS